MDLSSGKNLESTSRISIDNHFKVIAGPGAGKTTFLINHIKNILNTSKKISSYRKIACITYTNVGVENILKKVDTSSEHLEVSTIHSFLYKHIIKPYLWVLEDTFKFDLEKITGHDEIKASRSLLQEWREETKQHHLNDDKELSIALSKIAWILNDNEIKPGFREAYHGSFKNKKVGIKRDSLLEFKKICWKNGLIAHDDVLYLSHEILLKTPRILEIIRAKFPYILVDEFQDTNPIQSKIIKLIAEEESIIGVIGDNCQSIYSFQGADVSHFINFNLSQMDLYYIQNNHRSTPEIVNLLNYMRGSCSLCQKAISASNIKPKILVGDYAKIFGEVSTLSGNLCVLSFRNGLSNSLQYGTDYIPKDEIINDLFFDDGDRGKLILFVIYSIENAKQKNFKEALKNMKKAYRKYKFDDKDAFENLKRLIDKYDTFINLALTDFYNDFIFDHYNVKHKISSGKIKNKYDNLTYKRIASTIKLSEDISNFRTIHKSKGEEFDNVLVLIDPNNFKEDKNLDFLLNPDMTKEEHRVFYVALSRAKKSLFISIPSLTDSLKEKLSKISQIEIESISNLV